MKLIISLIIGLSCLFPGLVYASAIDLRLDKDEIAISFLPLSDGEAALLQTGNGGQFLINTGEKNSRKEIFYYMAKLQIRQLDGLIVTEKKYWHEMFIEQLADNRGLKKVITAWPVDEEKRDSRLAYERWVPGEIYDLGSEASLQPLYYGEGDDEGLDFSIRHRQSRFLWMSSASSLSEQEMLAQSLKDSNILKLPQFGKKDSLSYNLLTHIDPQSAILFKSKVDYPDDELLEVLHQTWIDVYYTDQQGLIIIKFTRDGYSILTIPEMK
ncbi:ComEC/Rec2 family competence protein [Bacillus thermotolerans]|uniref:ComEC/Rec2 family competence protein n=1 Tax=Bacillus thermotolerans TaxID=1221996 RepID=UPI00058382F9|nr:hypothetical protein [Bacillus thermotolerans]KKB38384.1 Late competence protein ComEC, DNA transport [Bacillus thermotolerans]KKB38484.1 Late competence protein ComEC, DNA transport [Bacillus thermotolerans]